MKAGFEMQNWNHRNYQRELEQIIDADEKAGIRPRLLIHSCCAPCSSYVLEYLSRYFDITVYYYNPNIDTKEEYERRTHELERLVREMPLSSPVHLEVGAYEPERFYDAARGHENDPERGERCRLCFELRLSEAAKKAAQADPPFDYFTTSLSISPMKDAALLNEIGEREGARYGVRYLPSDFKKKNGYKRSVELSRAYELYRQDYCGCVFSKAQREREKRELCHETKCGS